jgi:hypothetical protein
MLNNKNHWEKLGRIIAPNQNIYWLATYAGPSFARQINDKGDFDLFVTGRDEKNRSQIGIIKININDPQKIISISPDPVFAIGELGAFDENGVSYPYFVEWQGQAYMFYAGWMPTVLTPFINGIGLAKINEDSTFSRISRAPILPRNDDDFLSIGSCCALIEDDTWRLWYTCFYKWGKDSGEYKHYYVIKYAESSNGIDWIRKNRICIDLKNEKEFSISRPSVIFHDNLYHMWFSYRGKFYRIGYAYSKDGVHWLRRDDFANIDVSPSGWDSESICYSHVFKYNDHFYMIYNGNHYGRDGLGMAKLSLT